MNKNSYRGNYPNESQFKLLKACLSVKIDEAENYFKEWLLVRKLEKLDIHHPDFLSHFMDTLDVGSQRLIPLLRENLRGSSHPYLPYLNGYTKKTWFRNKQIEFYIRNLQVQLANNNIPSIIFKGLDYAKNYYPSFSSRPMNDGDLLIPLLDKERFFKLAKEGFFTFQISKSDSGLKQFVHAIHLVFPNDVDIDLHWNIFPEYSNDAWINDLVWENKNFDSQGSLRLSETLSFFLALTHGKNFDSVPPIRWVSDSVLIARSAEIDWLLFYELTKKTKFKPFILNAVNYLKEEFSLTIPDEILEKLNSLKSTTLEKKYYESISINIRKYGVISLVYYGTKRRFIFYNLFLKDYWPGIWSYLMNWYRSRFWFEIDNLKKRWTKR